MTNEMEAFKKAWDEYEAKLALMPDNHQQIIDNIEIDGKTLMIDLWYSTLPQNINTIEVGIMAVRAADSIRISYDFDRDGYSIQQASKFRWITVSQDDPCDSDWQEVAFIQAWGREETPEEFAKREAEEIKIVESAGGQRK